MPLIGAVLKPNMIVRWCDTFKLGVAAGLDLPSAMQLSSEAVGWPPLFAEGQSRIEALESGRPLDAAAQSTMLPVTVTASIQMIPNQDSLVATLGSLSDLYEQQAEIRLGVTQVMLGPILLSLLAVVIFIWVIGLFMPRLSMTQMLM